MTIDVFQKFTLAGIEFRISEHPRAKEMPYGQERRKAVVYQLMDVHGIPHALKVFKSRFRVPHITLVAEKLATYAGIYTHDNLKDHFPLLYYNINWQEQHFVKYRKRTTLLNPIF